MDAEQLTLWAGYDGTLAEREALVRGALFNAGFKACDVPRLAILCRALWEAEGSDFPPSVDDLKERIGGSRSTIKRQLDELQRCGIVETKRDEGRSARDPKRRAIDWNQTAKLARTSAAAVVEPAKASIADAAGSRSSSMVHREPTKLSMAQGEPTTRPFEPTRTDGGSVCLDIYPPTPLRTEAEAPGADASGSQKNQEGEGILKSWAEAEAELVAEGVGDARGAIRQARSGRASPEVVRSIVAEFRRRPGLSPGLLWKRVREAGPGTDPAKGWPMAPAEPVDAAEVARREERQRRETLEADQRRATVEAEARRVAELEALHGAAIDAAAERELVAALEATGRSSIVAALDRWGRKRSMVRGELLEAWAAVTVGS